MKAAERSYFHQATAHTLKLLQIVAYTKVNPRSGPQMGIWKLLSLSEYADFGRIVGKQEVIGVSCG